MSNLDTAPAPQRIGGRQEVTAQPVQELLKSREVVLGESTHVRRLLPTLGRRMVGAWCFVDHYGPDNIASEPGMQVPPHPHMGLQTVSWLQEGEVLHRDSLGSRQLLAPGQLGLMTAGHAVSHSEQSPDSHAPILHGAQLWVALPDRHRHVDAQWEHHQTLPVVSGSGLHSTVIMGEFDSAVSPGTAYTPLAGLQLHVDTAANARIPVEPDFEYAALTMSGTPEVDGVRLEPGSMLYLGCGRRELKIAADSQATLMLLGGEPFDEKIVMWWNFVGRTGAEIAEARGQWADGARFGAVRGYEGNRLPAPRLPDVPLKARGRTR